MEKKITKKFLEKHFKYRNKLTVYQGHIPLKVTKAWHFHLSGGHNELDIHDCTDLAEMFDLTGVTLKPTDRKQ